MKLVDQALVFEAQARAERAEAEVERLREALENAEKYVLRWTDTHVWDDEAFRLLGDIRAHLSERTSSPSTPD